MEKPGIIIESRVQWLSVIVLCSFLFISNCDSRTKVMGTRGTVKGILHDDAGRPVSDAIVMIVDGSSDFNDMASVSNEKGEFYISNVVIPGRYVIQIQGGAQQQRKEVNLTSPDTVLRINY
jgi:hypothetical protein